MREWISLIEERERERESYKLGVFIRKGGDNYLKSS
jgi:hypothetical protein